MASIRTRQENGACAYMQPQHSCAYYKNESFVKQKIEPPYDPTMAFLGIYWGGAMSYDRRTCASVFIAALFMIAGNGVNIDVHQPIHE